MKHIIIVNDMNCEKCVEKISEALSEEGIAFDINLEQKAVSIYERGDAVRKASMIISELGYHIA
ncbi:copper chaperone CopZ [Breznakia sp. PF5-3]|uniref:cation transporter n=1 Tax=unclassified Breznakia TaxID=2623764 RepID=UPI0024064C91|nr:MULTISPECIES: cation transporter [unclassified Breznakia]MDF9825448.1 copper chaperone CopZ [Breznakia sp. PM6-1]MDF9836326.1 copper chaperone CopZ [Breznakia sp. PF5-3]MDF9838557.1 copper chaperone CopZ [Breznakia sp. PFB2-8]MDF9860559.1 copper chaperone CopZ [Breznakia sp. PH5-24]